MAVGHPAVAAGLQVDAGQRRRGASGRNAFDRRAFGHREFGHRGVDGEAGVGTAVVCTTGIGVAGGRPMTVPSRRGSASPESRPVRRIDHHRLDRADAAGRGLADAVAEPAAGVASTAGSKPASTVVLALSPALVSDSRGLATASAAVRR